MYKNEVSWKRKDTSTYPALRENISADVVIIGGGMTGVVSAYLLANEGKKVVLIEKNKLGSGVTSHTTAFITQVIDTSVSELKDLYGLDKTKKVWESGAAAIELIENIVKEEKIECDFSRCSAFIYSRKEEELVSLKKDMKVAHKIGFETSVYEDNRLGFSNEGYWEIPNQAKFEPLKYLYALAAAATKKGARTYEKTEVLEISKDHPFKVETRDATVITDYVVSATYRPLSGNEKTFGKKGMYKSYVFEVEVPKNKIPEGLYWDRHNPYHYFRIDNFKGHSRIILGGEDHRDELPMSEGKNFSALEDYLRYILSSDNYKITKRWTGPILEPSDGLALIGETDRNMLLASAFSGNGMTYAHIAAMIFADIIQGRENEWVKVYDPLRPMDTKVLLKKALDYGEEFLGGAVKNILKY